MINGVRQGSVLAPSVFNTAIDFVMAGAMDRCECGASYGGVTVTDLDYTDDVAIFAQVLEVLQLAPQAMDVEIKPLGLMISWDKTKSDFDIQRSPNPSGTRFSLDTLVSSPGGPYAEALRPQS
ncbi:hypothetical protein Bbelb_362360 [Branchiostoma belcheri]|nr:hypothetical protein Bbelb_444710 [Branchiostoma belcheri]KAI8486106.1 hypothetical protein Bbelb_362060 [Branchiostoma belcheri]KAI8486136.1 hypothetical protein Bbelb_362360 [Branchiostoma belcheri]